MLACRSSCFKIWYTSYPILKDVHLGADFILKKVFCILFYTITTVIEN